MNDATLDDIHGRQNGGGLEHRLRGLADGVEAPPSEGARRAIGHRSRMLRRRRHVRLAVAGGAVAVVVGVAAVVGAVALRRDPADVRIAPATAGGEAGALPVIALAPERWTIAGTADHDDVAELMDKVAVLEGHSVQLFRPEGQLAGPFVHLEHLSATDAVVPGAGDQEVDLDGTSAYLSEADGTVQLRWSVAASDSQAQLTAFGLDVDEVVAFARGLEPLDEDLQVPLRPDSTFGFAATEAPAGLVEVAALSAAPDRPVDVRQAWFESGAGDDQQIVEIQVDSRGERDAELPLYDPAASTWGTLEQVTVLDRPALLRHDAADGASILQWRHTDDAWVTVTIADGSAPVDEIIDDLRELRAGQWQDLEADSLSRSGG